MRRMLESLFLGMTDLRPVNDAAKRALATNRCSYIPSATCMSALGYLINPQLAWKPHLLR